jgi:hypothetical protein
MERALRELSSGMITCAFYEKMGIFVLGKLFLFVVPVIATDPVAAAFLGRDGPACKRP